MQIIALLTNSDPFIKMVQTCLIKNNNKNKVYNNLSANYKILRIQSKIVIRLIQVLQVLQVTIIEVKLVKKVLLIFQKSFKSTKPKHNKKKLSQ